MVRDKKWYGIRHQISNIIQTLLFNINFGFFAAITCPIYGPCSVTIYPSIFYVAFHVAFVVGDALEFDVVGGLVLDGHLNGVSVDTRYASRICYVGLKKKKHFTNLPIEQILCLRFNNKKHSKFRQFPARKFVGCVLHVPYRTLSVGFQWARQQKTHAIKSFILNQCQNRGAADQMVFFWILAVYVARETKLVN